jgi:predicted SprT family Zn-dependent metalloprotease
MLCEHPFVTNNMRSRMKKYSKEWFRATISRWAEVWDTEKLEDRVSVVFSPRMIKSLGRCDLKSKTIRLNPKLKGRHGRILPEVLCHEAAHIAVHEKYGPSSSPHGEEWRQYVRQAGFVPRVTAGLEGLNLPPPARKTPSVLYEHRCPVCQMTRTSSRPVSRWRCAACVGAGLDGRLIVEKIIKPARGGM